MDRHAIERVLEDSIATKQRLLAAAVADIERLCALAVERARAGGTLFFCGNGGSSCDAAHAAGELVGWFERKQRGPFRAVALGHEVPTVTAISNDVGFEQVFARQLAALGRPGDFLLGISTSGGSKNVVLAMRQAKQLGLATAALTGERDGPLAELADVCVRVPSTDTARVQESHLVCIHLLCAAVENALAT